MLRKEKKAATKQSLNPTDQTHGFTQNYHSVSSSDEMDPKFKKLSKAYGFSKGVPVSWMHSSTHKLLLVSGLVSVVLGCVYMIGYWNGASSGRYQPFAVVGGSDQGHPSGEQITFINQHHREQDLAMKRLHAIEHMQGFKETYPIYQLSEEANEKGSYEEESEGDAISGDAEADEEVDEEGSADEDKSWKVLTSELTDGELFENAEEYQAAGYMSVPNKDHRYNLPYSLPKKNLWWGVKAYEKHYRDFPIKTVIPRLRRDVQLTVDEFHDRFRKTGQPVLFNFENLRNLGFSTKNYSLEELKLMFPYDEEQAMSKVQSQFVANGIRKADEELDLGPGLVAIERDEELAKQGKLRSFPRNLKVKQESIKKLDVQSPPLIKSLADSKHSSEADVSKTFQLPTVWMGTSSSDTRFHHDCCDNFVMMILGTKRFTLAPTSDWRLLAPQCVGKYKALCWANVNNPNAEFLSSAKEKAAMKYVNKFVVDVGPGDILYMPAGWFHHIQNLGPTLMVNWWTKGKETCGVMRAKNTHN